MHYKVQEDIIALFKNMSCHVWAIIPVLPTCRSTGSEKQNCSNLHVVVFLLEVAKFSPASGISPQQGNHIGPDDSDLLLIGAPPTRGHVPRQVAAT